MIPVITFSGYQCGFIFFNLNFYFENYFNMLVGFIYQMRPLVSSLT